MHVHVDLQVMEVAVHVYISKVLYIHRNYGILAALAALLKTKHCSLLANVNSPWYCPSSVTCNVFGLPYSG